MCWSYTYFNVPSQNDQPFKHCLSIYHMMHHHQILDSFSFFFTCFQLAQDLYFFLELTDRRPRCSEHQFLSGKKYYMWIHLGNIHFVKCYLFSIFWEQKGSLNLCNKHIFPASPYLHTFKGTFLFNGPTTNCTCYSLDTKWHCGMDKIKLFAQVHNVGLQTNSTNKMWWKSFI